MSSPKRQAVYDEFLKVPDWKVAEIIDGELVVNPRPAIPHALRRQRRWVRTSAAPFNGPPGASRAPGGWWILDRAGIASGRRRPRAGPRRLATRSFADASPVAFMTTGARLGVRGDLTVDRRASIAVGRCASMPRERRHPSLARRPAPRTLEVYRLESRPMGRRRVHSAATTLSAPSHSKRSSSRSSAGGCPKRSRARARATAVARLDSPLRLTDAPQSLHELVPPRGRAPAGRLRHGEREEQRRRRRLSRRRARDATAFGWRATSTRRAGRAR